MPKRTRKRTTVKNLAAEKELTTKEMKKVKGGVFGDGSVRGIADGTARPSIPAITVTNAGPSDALQLLDAEKLVKGNK